MRQKGKTEQENVIIEVIKIQTEMNIDNNHEHVRPQQTKIQKVTVKQKHVKSVVMELTRTPYGKRKTSRYIKKQMTIKRHSFRKVFIMKKKKSENIVIIELSKHKLI